MAFFRAELTVGQYRTKLQTLARQLHGLPLPSGSLPFWPFAAAREYLVLDESGEVAKCSASNQRRASRLQRASRASQLGNDAPRSRRIKCAARISRTSGRGPYRLLSRGGSIRCQKYT